jgi:universal stress protein E
LLGTVARKGFSAFWLGNTAEDVLPRVECDVLLLRPQDYFDPD